MADNNRILSILESLGNWKQLAGVNELAVLWQLPSNGLSLGCAYISLGCVLGGLWHAKTFGFQQTDEKLIY